MSAPAPSPATFSASEAAPASMTSGSTRVSPTAPDSNEATRRPGGISFIAGINLLGAVVVLLAAFGVDDSAVTAALFALGALALTMAIGLLGMRPWARWAAIASYVLNCILSLVQFNPIALIVSGLLIRYLLSDPVATAFQSASSHERRVG